MTKNYDIFLYCTEEAIMSNWMTVLFTPWMTSWMIVDVYYYSYACQSVLNLCSCPKIFTVFLSLKSFILAGKFLQYKEIITLTCVSSLFYQTPQPASVKSKYFFYQLQKPQLHNMILEKFNSNLSLLIALSIYLVSIC